MPGGVKAGQSGSAALPCKDIALAATGWEAGEGTTPPSSEYKSSPKLAEKSSLPMPESLNFPHPKHPYFPSTPHAANSTLTHTGGGWGRGVYTAQGSFCHSCQQFSARTSAALRCCAAALSRAAAGGFSFGSAGSTERSRR